MKTVSQNEIAHILIAVLILIVLSIAMPADAQVSCNITWPTIPGAPDINAICAGTETLSIGQLVLFIFSAAIWLGGIVAFVSLVYAGFMYVFSGASPANRAKANKMLQNVLWGIGILLFSVIALNLINPDITSLRDPSLMGVNEGNVPDVDISDPDNFESPFPPPSMPGLQSPPNLGPPIFVPALSCSGNKKDRKAGTYYTLPESDDPGNDNLYTRWTEERSRGNKLLVDVIYTVALRWTQAGFTKYRLGDLNKVTCGHITHHDGTHVDLIHRYATSASAARSSFKTANDSITLAKMLVDTGQICQILAGAPGNEFPLAVYKEVNNYFAKNYSYKTALRSFTFQGTRFTNPIMKPITGHNTHFHVKVKRNDGTCAND